MTDIRSLERTLLDNLPWNKARIKFVAPLSPGSQCHADGQSFDSGHSLLRPCQRGIELQTTPTLYAGIRDALCRTRAVHREVARLCRTLHPGAGSDELESRRS